MNEFLSAFIQGFVKGAKETPRGFFAPAIYLWQRIVKMYDSVIFDQKPT